MNPGIPFESNPPPDAMPDLELEVEALPLTREPEAGDVTEPQEKAERHEEKGADDE